MIPGLKDDAVAVLQANLAQGEQAKLVVRGGRDTAIVATDWRVFVFDRGLFGNLKAYTIPYFALEAAEIHDGQITLTGFGLLDGNSAVRTLPLPALMDPTAEEQAAALGALVISRDTGVRRSYPWPSLDIECDRCGRLTSMPQATVQRFLAAGESRMRLSVSDWDRVQHAADRANPLRPGHLERMLGISYEDAVAGLEDLVRLRLLDQYGNGYVRSAMQCETCSTPGAAGSPKRTERDPIPAQLRFRVLQRDGFRCQYCGANQRDGVVLHVDHVVPHSRGGQTTEDNLITACESCNLGKAASSVLGEA